MPLSVAKASLEASILEAFEKMRSGEDNKTLAKDLAKAIHIYTTQADVDPAGIISTVPPGVGVSTVGTPLAQAGSTITPGIAQHIGYGSLK